VSLIYEPKKRKGGKKKKRPKILKKKGRRGFGTTAPIKGKELNGRSRGKVDRLVYSTQGRSWLGQGRGGFDLTPL